MKKTGYGFAPVIVLCLAAIAQAIPITDGLIVHLKASSLALNEGDTVAVWPDLAASDTVDGTLIQAESANLPTFKKAAHFGFPAVHFDAANTQALMSNIWTWDESAGLCVFMVCTAHGAVGGRVVHIGNVDGHDFKSFQCDVQTNQEMGSGVRWNNGWTLTDLTVNPDPLQEGVWHTSVRQVAQGGRYDSLIYAVDTFPALAMASNYPDRQVAFDAASNIISVGNSRENTATKWASNAWYTGDISEILVYNTQLSQPQMEQMLDYLNNQDKLAAHNPEPANNATDQGIAAGDKRSVTFRWNTGLNESLTDVNPNITHHHCYLADNPDLTGTSAYTMVAGSATAFIPATLDPDKTYYWRIDEAVNSSGPDDPATIRGPVWSFRTAINEPDNNPVFTAADPDVLIVGDKVYVYPTHGGPGKFYTFSSSNLVDWQKQGPILNFANVSWSSATRSAWAPGIVERNGLYYLYFSEAKKPANIGVGVSNSPTGPFVDSGRPLVSDGGDPTFTAIDAMVFKDPISGTYYLYCGGATGATLRIFELNDDLISIAREVSRSKPTNFSEGAYMHYRNGIYYMSYSHGGWKYATYSVHYSTAPTPTGPWTYRGAILSSNDTYKGPGHHSVLYNAAMDEWYVFYHRWENVTGSGPYTGQRVIAIDRLYYDSNGLMRPVVMTQRGVGPVPLGRFLASDFTKDGSVDLLDLDYLCNKWLSSDTKADIAPIPHDGFVNIKDWQTFSKQWLR